MFSTYPKITIIGAGNGGQAIAGYCASLGLSVCLYNRTLEKIEPIVSNRTIELRGIIVSKAQLKLVTDNIRHAIEFGDIIMIVTTASAHRSLAEKILPYLKNDQILILNPGRTCGVLEVGAILSSRPDLKIGLAEAQTLVYACRIITPGVVNIIGVKQRVMLAGRNKGETKNVIEKIRPIYPCFVPADNLIQTGLLNVGAIFHPAIVVFNIAAIERNNHFYFYRDITPNIANFIQSIDEERLNIGQAYGFNLMPVSDWILYAYPETKGNNLCERIKNNPAYYDIMGPGSIFTRQLTEDIPTGLIPMSELALVVNVSTPLMNAIITLSSSLLGIDFRKQGRTLNNLQLSNLDKEGIIQRLS